MQTNSRIIPIALPSGRIICVEATSLNPEADVAYFDPKPFTIVTEAIEEIATSVVATLEQVRPSRASVEFGLEIALEAGQITALLVKGTGTANLKITLEWGKE